MKIQKWELAQKINKLKSVVPKKPSGQAVQGILVRDGCMTASSLELTVKAKIGGAEGETFIIPARAFDLINNLPDGEVEIVPKGGDAITIKAEKIKNKYQTMDPSLFPEPGMPEGNGREAAVKSEVLLASMRRVSYAIPAQSGNSLMTALCLKASGGTLDFVGLDGHVLAWDRADYEGEFELLIPKNTVEKLLSIGLSGEVSIRHSRNSAAFVTEDYEVYTRIMEGKYFSYSSMFREQPFHTAAVRTDFLEAMVRAKMCVEEKCPVILELMGNEMNISIRDSTADYHETVALQEALPERMVIGFDARLVIETMKAFDCGTVGIQLAGPKSPMIVEAENSRFRAIVLPVAIRQ